ncbi:uncharacterized protein LOC143231654 [Tachypleus tridentatus]|uniref:uncharacterized protein LOC143231654 n=1 Tax=Tachypleus tridentatus TaxID=6853 RepID=UPI003FD1824C
MFCPSRTLRLTFMNCPTMLIFITLAAFLGQVVSALRLQKMEVPTAVSSGDPVRLNCTYNLESEQLYSVKWYKNNVEFYRYLPNDNPPAQKYNLLGVYVDLNKSRFGQVYLSRSDLNTEGTYRCEVSAEAPTFQTERAERELRVYTLPKGGPKIHGTKAQYSPGDEVNVTCTAAPSKPVAVIKWYINDEKAPENSVKALATKRHPDGLQSSKSALRFNVLPSHLKNNALKLRCTAIISQAYSMKSKEIIIGNTVRPSGLYTAADGPTISGGLPKYQVGDLVDVGCTSSKSQNPAKLAWSINDKMASPDLTVYQPPVVDNMGLKASVLELKFTVKAEHFHKGEMRLKCTATLYKVINTSSEETVIGVSHLSSGLHVLENSEKVHNNGSRSSTASWVSIVSTCFVIILLF